jgi:hypothetical protein
MRDYQVSSHVGVNNLVSF